MPKKIDYQKLEKQLTIQRKSCWEVWNSTIKNKAFSFAEDYKKFLNQAKTVSESVKTGIVLAKKQGFKDLNDLKTIKPGDKIYYSHQGKSLIMAKIGKRDLTEGVKIIMSHIDSSHLDLKVSPLYEDEKLAFFKTHYYGAIKKYQWPTIALALHGTIYLEDGKEIEVVIGEDENDPVFMITDLLPHLDRAGGPGSEVKKREVQGEDLNLVIGSIPVRDEKVKEKVKLAILEYLNKQYNIKEEDFSSAELSAVPSEKARDLGFDRSLVSAYGHDDRVCAYSSLKAFFDNKISDSTLICIWIDREEIGSEGSTGAQSMFIESFVSTILEMEGKIGTISNVYKVFSKSRAISADVTAALDPDYKDVHDLRNTLKMGYGIAIEKYTGSGGKYDTSEASGKYIQELRTIFKKNKNILFQIGGGLGKVDQGGGGTIAKYMANRNIEIVDMGVALFNMHAPLEIVSKADLYCAYLAYKEFFAS
jgi:aspartyl aminopeptidase